jgi:hypothetical protein
MGKSRRIQNRRKNRVARNKYRRMNHEEMGNGRAKEEQIKVTIRI